MPGQLRTRPTVLVTDASRGSAVSIIRSLGRRGWRVLAADSDPASPGFRSRYTAGRVQYPPPEVAPLKCVDTLLQSARAEGVDLVIPVTDAVILPLSEQRERFEGVCRLALPDREALRLVTDKQSTLDLARRLDVPVPETRLVHSADGAVACVPALGWPVVLKPQASRQYRAGEAVEAFTVSYADNLATLRARMQPLEGRCPVLLQEYCSGEGVGVEFLAHEGRPLAAFQHRRLREVPVSGGASAFRESVPLDPALYELSERLIRALRWTGLAMVEFRIGADGPRLMEINGRVWGSLPLAVWSGMDFPGRLADLWLTDASEAGVPPETGYRVGVKSRNLSLEATWIATVLMQRRRYQFLPLPRRSAALGALLQLGDPRLKFDIFSLDDPRPALSELWQIARGFRRKLKE